MLNTLQVQKVLGVSMETIYKYLRAKQLPGVMPFGRRNGWHVKRADLIAFMEAKGLPVDDLDQKLEQTSL